MSSYKGKYLRTYLWSGLSLMLSFISMFIVAPLTTSMPEAYGVYSLCISFAIFLRYADLGFIAAGVKYAAEAYSVNDYKLEKRYLGNSIMIYGVMSLVLFVLALLFSIYPEYLIRDIDEGPYYNMAQKLLLIFALTIPFSIINKFCSLIYSVRIEEYKIQRFQIIGSVVKIASVPLYFFCNRYDLVGYYMFSELVNIIIGIILLYKSNDIGYGGREFLKCLKFDKKIFDEVKPLALSGFASVIGWITYFELDTIGVSVLLGANAVAVYAVGKQIQTFVRSLVSIVFSPYPVRINYFIGQKDYDGLKKFFYNFAELFSIIVIPIVAIVLYAKPFVIAWVGNDYDQSAFIIQLLVLTFILHHVTSQGGSVIYGLNKVKDVLKIAFIQPFFFWIGVFATYRFWGIESFAIFKLAACLVTDFFYLYLVRKYLNYTKAEIYWHLVAKPLVILTIVSIVIWYYTSGLLDNVSKGHQDLFFVISIMALCCLFALIIDFLFNRTLREETQKIVQSIIK